VSVGASCSRCQNCPGRSEPVKAVCARRATAPVELPGEPISREDDLDRTCPDQEMAAIGSRDTGGQDQIQGHVYQSHMRRPLKERMAVSCLQEPLRA
jgi:hypothetical protein